MTKKHFIAFADHIKTRLPYVYTTETLESLADFCQSQNPLFKRERWLEYIAGKCGKNGGKR